MSSVASKNPFALLGDGGDDEAPAKAPAKAPAPPAPAAPAKEKPRSTGPASRGGKYYQRGGSRSSGRDGAGNPNQNGIDEPEGAPRKFEGRGRGRGGRGGSRGGKRPFDRHSATGKTDSEKKIHQGWGGDDGNTELQAESAANKDAATESAAPNEWDGTANADAWGATADAAATEGADAGAADKGEGRPPRKEREREEEEDNTLTLEQYLAQQKDKDTVVPKPELRKANEGAADDLWKDAVALQKSDEDAYFVGKSKAAPKARAKKEEKVFLEIDGRFERPSRGGRGGRGGERGGRGGGDRGGERGGRGRGEGRGGRGGRSNNGPAAPTFSVDDEAAFPSLS